MTEKIIGKTEKTFFLWEVETNFDTKTKTFTRVGTIARSLEKTQAEYPNLPIDDTLSGTLLTRTYNDLSDSKNYTEVKGKKTTTTKPKAVKENTTSEATEPKKRGRPKKVVDTESVDILHKATTKTKSVIDDDDFEVDVEFADKANRVGSKYSNYIDGFDDTESEFETTDIEFDENDLSKIDIDAVLNDNIFDDEDDLF